MAAMLAPPAFRTISRTVAARKPRSEKTSPAASRSRSRVSAAGTGAVLVIDFKPSLKTLVLNKDFKFRKEKRAPHQTREHLDRMQHQGRTSCPRRGIPDGGAPVGS